MTLTLHCADVEATRALGRRVGALAVPGTVLALDGDLGAGKTVFAKGVGEGLAVPTRVTSPTFVLVALHEDGRLPLWHVDLYRLADGEDLDDLELDEAVEGVLLVEWASRFRDALPADRLDIALEHDGDARIVRLDATGPRHQALVEALRDR